MLTWTTLSSVGTVTPSYHSIPTWVVNWLLETAMIISDDDSIEKKRQTLEGIFPFGSGWMKDLEETPIPDILNLSEPEVYLYSILKGIPCRSLNRFDRDSLRNYVQYEMVFSDVGCYWRYLPRYIDQDVTRFFIGKLFPFPVISDRDFEQALKQGKLDSDVLLSRIARASKFFGAKYSYTIPSLYGVGTHELERIFEFDEHPLESMLIGMGEYPSENIAIIFDMVIPNHMDVELYVEQNIIDYVSLHSGFELNWDLSLLETMNLQEIMRVLLYYQDRSLLSLFGDAFVLIYSSRRELVQTVAKLIKDTTFFIAGHRNSDASVNKETLMLTDITDEDTFFVSYGKYNRYHTYELGDFLASFQTSYRRPDDQRLLFDKNEVDSLVQLFFLYGPIDEYIQLTACVDAVEIHNMDVDAVDVAAMNKFQFIADEEKVQIRELLYKLFDSAMYMRRWKGPGTPYPMSEKDTLVEYIPDAEVSETMIESERITEALSSGAKELLDTFLVRDYEHGQIVTLSLPLGRLKQEVLDGSYCIRAASKLFIGTTMHYLRILFKERVNLDQRQLQGIE